MCFDDARRVQLWCDAPFCRWTLSVRWWGNFYPSKDKESYWWKRPVVKWVRKLTITSLYCIFVQHKISLNDIWMFSPQRLRRDSSIFPQILSGICWQVLVPLCCPNHYCFWQLTTHSFDWYQHPELFFGFILYCKASRVASMSRISLCIFF